MLAVKPCFFSLWSLSLIFCLVIASRTAGWRHGSLAWPSRLWALAPSVCHLFLFPGPRGITRWLLWGRPSSRSDRLQLRSWPWRAYTNPCLLPCSWTCAAHVIASFGFGCQSSSSHSQLPLPINILLILQGLARISLLWSLFQLNPAWVTHCFVWAPTSVCLYFIITSVQVRSVV